MSMEEGLRNVEAAVGLRRFGPDPQRAGVDGVLHVSWSGLAEVQHHSIFTMCAMLSASTISKVFAKRDRCATGVTMSIITWTTRGANHIVSRSSPQQENTLY